jgi:hypothetical protein
LDRGILDVSPAEPVIGTLALRLAAPSLNPRFTFPGSFGTLAVPSAAPSLNLRFKFTRPFGPLARKFLLPPDAPTLHFGAPSFSFPVDTSFLWLT